MPSAQENPVVFTGMRGRDGSTASVFSILKTKFREAINIDLYRCGFARKRGGSTSVFAATTAESFAGVISSLIRHQPGNSAAAAELWAFDGDAPGDVGRLTGGTAWATPTLNEDYNGGSVCGASFNGKLFLAYLSGTDRLHVWDGSTVRRVGFTQPGAETNANTGSGAYAATLRYYQTIWLEISSSTVVRQSERGTGSSFTPSGSGTAVRITQPTPPGAGETHWRVYGSADNQTYFNISGNIAIGTTTYDDSVAPSAYTGDAPPLVGQHTNWTSVKFLISTGNALVGMGGYAAGAKNNRVWFSAALGSTGNGDDECVPQTVDVNNYVDLDENDGGEGTGLGMLGSRVIVFKRNQTWQLIPTGLDNPVYLPREIDKGSGVGCIRHQTIVRAVDEAGKSALYWLSESGPYRLGANGPQTMVDDIQDLWDTVNLGATTAVGHGVYHAAKHQVWWWVATGSSNDPDTLLIFDVQLGRTNERGRVVDGWTQFTGDIAAARCSVMFSNTLGATMSKDLKPYLGRSTGTTILKADTADTDDAATDFQAYVDLPYRHFAGLDKKATLGQSVILGSAGSQSLQITVTRNYGQEAGITDSVSMAANGSETRALRTLEGSAYGDDAYAHAIRIGDSAASDATWTIDAVLVPFEARESVTQ